LILMWTNRVNLRAVLCHAIAKSDAHVAPDKGREKMRPVSFYFCPHPLSKPTSHSTHEMSKHIINAKRKLGTVTIRLKVLQFTPHPRLNDGRLYVTM
jgi:hypothetical protein